MKRFLAARGFGGRGCVWFWCCWLAALCVSAQTQITWSKVSGGGGTSIGGAYAVSGTIGQPDAGYVMAGGNYSLQGGFWALVAVQVPGAPVLTIVPIGAGQASISWSPDSPGWVLQETLSLSAAAWANSSSGSTNHVVVPFEVPTKFYRLNKP